MTVTDGRRVIDGRYRLMAKIGSGGAGVVWQAQDSLLDRQVAVKEIARLAALDADERADSYERMLREARAAARIIHPGVAAVYDVVSEDGCPYIVMELVRGRPLSGIIDDDGPLPSAQVADIGRQVLDALMAGHAAGVLHRDLKPANLMITGQGRVVLTDFGIASVAGDPSLTRTGMVVGTPGYLAPERLRGEPATPAADLWSLGATLYMAACGHGPFEGYDGAMATMYEIATGEPAELPVDGPLRPIVAALLARDPRRRPAAAAAAWALDEIAGRPAKGNQASPNRVATSEPASARVVAEPDAASLSLLADTASAPLAVLSQAPRRARRRRRTVSLRAGIAAAALVVTAAAASVGIAVALGKGATPKAGSAALSQVPPVTTQFRVTAVAGPQGSTELFARAPDGSLMQRTVPDGSWTALPSGKQYTGVPAVVAGPGGQPDVFARTSSGTLAELRQDSDGSWEAPVSVSTGDISSDPSVQALPGGQLEAFARLYDGSLGYTVQSGSTWSAWMSLGGSLAGPPVAALDSAGQPEVFAIASDGALVRYYHGSGGWTGPGVLPGRHVYTGVPAVGRNLDGRLEVFARTKSGTIEHVWQQPGAPQEWGGPLPLITGAVSNPAVMSVNGGRLELFAAAANGQLWHTWQLRPVAGAGWSRTESLGGTSSGAPEVIRVDGKSELFERVPGGTIGYDHLDTPTGTWAGWSSLNGSF
jgi:hypothetical protein